MENGDEGTAIAAMNEERYPGEAQGLRLFMRGLLIAVETTLGRDALLYHRVRTALQRGDLQALRDARQMFNHQDSELKRRLSLAGLERPLNGRRPPRATAHAGTIIRLPGAVPPGE